MKKTITFILFVIVSSMCLTACTEEEVTPTGEIVTAMGKVQDPY